MSGLQAKAKAKAAATTFMACCHDLSMMISGPNNVTLPVQQPCIDSCPWRYWKNDWF